MITPSSGAPQLDAGPLLQPLIRLGAAVDFVGDALDLVANGLDFVVRDRPGLQSVLRPIDGVEIGLHIALGVEQKDFGHDLGMVFGPFEHFLVQLQLREGVEEVVFLVAQIDAVEHGQQVTFADNVPGLQVAARGAFPARRNVSIVSLANLHHLGRRKADADADQARRIDLGGTGHHQRHVPRGDPGHGNLFAAALQDAQRLPHFFRHKEAVGAALYEFYLRGLVGRRARLIGVGLHPGKLARRISPEDQQQYRQRDDDDANGLSQRRSSPGEAWLLELRGLSRRLACRREDGIAARLRRRSQSSGNRRTKAWAWRLFAAVHLSHCWNYTRNLAARTGFASFSQCLVDACATKPGV